MLIYLNKLLQAVISIISSLPLIKNKFFSIKKFSDVQITHFLKSNFLKKCLYFSNLLAFTLSRYLSHLSNNIDILDLKKKNSFVKI